MADQPPTVRECIERLGAGPECWAGAQTTTDEFNAIRKLYFKKILVAHPDKGGDAAEFRAIQEAWESIRALFDAGRVHAAGFSHYFQGIGSSERSTRGSAPQARSWEWFAEAAEEAVPGYKVEPAKSGRSKCNATGIAKKHDEPLIPKDAVRCGSLDSESGGYGRWVHLECWRVPAAIWLGLPKQGSSAAEFEVALESMGSVTLTGFAQLNAADRAAVVAHCMNQGNHAKLQNRKKKGDEEMGEQEEEEQPKGKSKGKAKAKRGRPAKKAKTEAAAPEPAAEASKPTPAKPAAAKPVAQAPPMAPNFAAQAAYFGIPNAAPSAYHQQATYQQAVVPVPRPTLPQSTALVPGTAAGGAGSQFILPRPGATGVPNAFAGQTFVMTGIFPEVGGGAGLDLGKTRVREFIESFGGRVTGSVSRKTTYLVVGKEPGLTKVSAAISKNVAQVDVLALKRAAEAPETAALINAPAPEISSWSSGYYGNGKGILLEGGSTYQRMLTDGGEIAAEYAAPRTGAAKPARGRAKKAAAPKRKRKVEEFDEEFDEEDYY